MTTETTDKAVAQRPLGLKEMLARVDIKARFNEILGQKAPAFISSIISSYQGNKALQDCEPGSIIAAASIAASLDLPLSGSLGFAALVPYGGQAQFQIMKAGWIQLGQRTGLYKTMSATEVYDGQLVSENSITGEYDFNAKAKTSDKVVGYVFYFRLVSGFEKYTYMTVSDVEAHGKKYSKSYENPKGLWKQNFQAMALKTVIKKGLKWGPLSTELMRALDVDQATIKEDGKLEYIDGTTVPDAPEKVYEGPKKAEDAPQAVQSAQDDRKPIKVKSMELKDGVYVIRIEDGKKLVTKEKSMFDYLGEGLKYSHGFYFTTNKEGGVDWIVEAEKAK